MQDLFAHRDKNAHGVIAEDSALGDAGDELGFRDSDREAIVLIDVHHDRQIGAAIAHVDDAVMADTECGTEFFEHGDLAPSRRSANDGVHFSGCFLVTEARAENMIRRHDTLERRFDDLLRRGRNNIEVKFVALSEIVERPREQRDVVLQADTLARFGEMFPAHFSKIRIVQNQVA